MLQAPPALLVAPDDLTAVDDAVASYIADLGSPESRRAYETVWRFYTHWLSEQRPAVAITEARPKHIMAYGTTLRDKGQVKGTIDRALTVIRSLYSSIVCRELMPINPAREVKSPKAPSKPKRPWIQDAADIKKLMNVPASTWAEKRDRMIVRLTFGLGWRRAEVARARIEDIDFKGRKITAPLIKGGKELTVKLPKKVAKQLTEWLEFSGIKSGPLFPRRQNDPRPVDGAGVYHIVKKLCVKAGIKVVPPHALRRTCLTHAGIRGVSLKERQLAVGHASSATTEGYDRARDASEACPGDKFDDLFEDDDDDGGDAEAKRSPEIDSELDALIADADAIYREYAPLAGSGTPGEAFAKMVAAR